MLIALTRKLTRKMLRDAIPTEQHYADRGVFVVENLCNLKDVLAQGGRFTACTYPMSCSELTGIPCRVIARIVSSSR